jgi:hypothetical protein
MTLLPEVERALLDAVRRDMVRARTHQQRRGLCWRKADIGRRWRPLALRRSFKMSGVVCSRGLRRRV